MVEVQKILRCPNSKQVQQHNTREETTRTRELVEEIITQRLAVVSDQVNSINTASANMEHLNRPPVAHLQPLTNVPAKYQLPTPYGCRDIARTRFSKSRSLRQGQRSNQGQTMTLHTYTPQPMSLPSMNFLHLKFLRYSPDKLCPARPTAHPDTMGENNTPTALKGCGVTSDTLPSVPRTIRKGNLVSISVQKLALTALAVFLFFLFFLLSLFFFNI